MSGPAVYIAFSGHAWMVQAEAGAGSGAMTMHDESCSPDLSESMWKVHSGGAWRPRSAQPGPALHGPAESSSVACPPQLLSPLLPLYDEPSAEPTNATTAPPAP